MIHLEKLAFLLLIAAGAALYVAAQGNPRIKQARAWIEAHLLWLVGGLLCIVALVGIAAANISNFVELPVVRHLNTPPYVKVPLGLLCGALLVELAVAIKKVDFSTLNLAARAVPFVFFFTIGFFSYELQLMLHYLTRIEAGGITLDFTSSGSDEIQTLIPSDAADVTGFGSGDIRTAFQLGISLFPEAFDTMKNDRKRIKSWCDTFESLNCGTIEKAEHSGQGKGDTTEKPERSVPVTAGANQYLLDLFEKTDNYLKILSPLQECLSGMYVDYFPNGSPIQEELSEFAAAVSIDFAEEETGEASDVDQPTASLSIIPLYSDSAWLDWRNAPASIINLKLHENELTDPELSVNERRLSPYLTELQHQLARFGEYADQYEFSGADTERDEKTSAQIEICKNLKNISSGDSEPAALTIGTLSDALEQIKTVNDHARKWLSDSQNGEGEDLGAKDKTVSKKGFSLPYVSIFEAAIIASSGYPEEAAHHMVREYEQLSSAAQQRKFGIRKGDFSEFLLQVRLLSPLEQIFAYSRNRAEQVRYAEAMVDRVAKQFNKIEPFQSEKISSFVHYCADNRLFPSDAKVINVPTSETRREIEIYFRSLVDFYLRSYARLLEAVANDPSIFTKSERFERFARVAEDLGSLASNDPSVVSGCIAEGLEARYVDSERVNQLIELLRYDLLAAYGFVLARQADQREIDPEVAPHIDRSFKKDVTCEAQRILLQAWRLRHVAEPESGESTYNAYTSKSYKIRRILEQINRSGVECAA